MGDRQNVPTITVEPLVEPTLRLKTQHVIEGWVLRDLMFILESPPTTGPLAPYKTYQLAVYGSDGRQRYWDPLDRPDASGVIHARVMPLDPRGGILIVSAMYEGEIDLNRVNPTVMGSCHYDPNVSGESLVFRIVPVTVLAGAETETRLSETSVSEPTTSETHGGNIEFTIPPVKVGGGGETTITRTGDVYMTGQRKAHTTTATSVTRLEITQIGERR